MEKKNAQQIVNFDIMTHRHERIETIPCRDNISNFKNQIPCSNKYLYESDADRDTHANEVPALTTVLDKSSNGIGSTFGRLDIFCCTMPAIVRILCGC